MQDGWERPEQELDVGHLAHLAGVELHELSAEASDLEKVFLDLTSDVGAA